MCQPWKRTLPAHPAARLRSLAALGLAACAPGDSSPALSVTTRDSAGILIVENHADPATAHQWRLSAEPSIRIGSLDGPPETQFFRVSGAMRLEDGTLVVADGGSREIRLFDAGGGFLRAFGGEGDGPEQFGDLRELWATGDTLEIYDQTHQRIAAWTTEGEFLGVRSLTPKSPGESVGRFGDGGVLMVELHFTMPKSGFAWMPITLQRYGRDGTFRDTIGEYPWMQYGLVEGQGGGPPHFATRTVAAAHDDRTYIATGRAREVEVVSPVGVLLGLMRWSGPPLDVTEEDVTRLRRATLSAAEGDSSITREAARRFDAFPVNDLRPSLADLDVGRDGRIWVREFDPDPAEQTWLVFDPEGRLSGRIEIPSALQMLEMGEDYVLGAEPDVLGVEYVVLYEFHMGAAALPQSP